ncbi:MAG: LD-carboxypeptidase, partial [Deltaproteobacteria bacterium]|nr:LD-carboxypeptidase [Deltaproteobacteria bacterium]
LAGKFDGVRGVVFSEMTGCLHNSRKNVRTYLRRYFRDAPFPVFLGFPSGHGIENVTIPLGVRVSIDSKKKRLFFEESGVR